MRWVAWLVFTALACDRAPRTELPPAASRSRGGPSIGAQSAPRIPVQGAAGQRCGALACERFKSPEAAFERVLATHPAVLAVGETHAQKDLDAATVSSSTRRFTDAFVPMLADRASDLVIELWIGNPSCGKNVAQVAAAQRAVSATQAPTDQNEFIALGDVAKSKGIMPHALVPGCSEYAKILDAGAGDVDAMLSMIARLTARETEVLIAARADAGAAAGKMVVAYGGAMHNDLEPRPGREAWSFGPELFRVTSGRYVELDLIVPEAIKDTEAWRSLPWFAHFDRDAHRSETVLITVRPGSYVLIFPRSL